MAAAAAGKKSTTSLVLVHGSMWLGSGGGGFYLATQCWAEGVWTGKWHHEQREAWMKQVRRKFRCRRQGRGPAGAVMRETRDLGVKWPHWHTLMFEGDRNIDMRCVCPKDVKNMLLQQARTVCWKKWAAKHEYEELKEGIWLEPALAIVAQEDEGRLD